MNRKRSNILIVIENGQLMTYSLDDKNIWEVGRPSRNNVPDIKLHSRTASRKHGKFQNMDGVWFYLDYNGKNGTVYNGKHIGTGLKGRVKPVFLNDGDIFIFGGGEKPVINYKTIWAMFSKTDFGEQFQTVDSKEYHKISVTDGEDTTVLQDPVKGTVVEKKDGIAIYMGDITYLIGDVRITGE